MWLDFRSAVRALSTAPAFTAGTGILPGIRQAIREIDPNLPLHEIVTLDELGRMGHADRRFLSWLLAVSAALGLMLAVIGVYAMTASWFVRRRRELGPRVAWARSRRAWCASC